jgi:hypothetical protein
LEIVAALFQNTFGLCTLKIIDARLDDTGVYTARAVNRIGEMSTSAELYVEGKQRILLRGTLFSSRNRDQDYPKLQLLPV